MKIVATHNNRFHPDDVFAVATLQLIEGVENVKIVRTRDEEKINNADYVVDVGMIYAPEDQRFDHHQSNAPVRESGIPYAAFGLVWHAYGEVLTSQFVAERIETSLVQPVDAGDNGYLLYEVKEGCVPPAELFSVITSYVPLGDASDEEYDNAFFEAVNFAREYLKRTITNFSYLEEELQRAQKIYKQSTNKNIVVSDEPVSSHLFSQFPDAQIVVAPKSSGDNVHWRATTVNEPDKAFARRVDFPSTWAGKRDQELEEASGIEGSLFCHRGLFLYVAKTKEAALRAAQTAIDK